MQAVDALTPLGRGQALMVNGPAGSGKTSLGLDCILAQRLQGVRCIYAAINQRYIPCQWGAAVETCYCELLSNLFPSNARTAHNSISRRHSTALGSTAPRVMTGLGDKVQKI